MASRRRMIAGALALVSAFLVFGMLTIDLRLAASSTNTNSTNSSVNSFSHADLTKFDAFTQKICFHVNDRVGLASTLSWEIREALRTANRFNVYLVNNDPGADDHPLLVAEIENPSVLWTPVYGRATFNVKYVYATDTADPKILQAASDSLEPESLPEKFQLRVRGSISVSDSTKGLITLPAYRKHLAETAAEPIVKAITKALDGVKKKMEEKVPENAGNA